MAWHVARQRSQRTSESIRSTEWSVRRAVPAQPLRRACPLRSCWKLFTSSSMKTIPAASSSGTSVSLLDSMCLIRFNIRHRFTGPHALEWGVYVLYLIYCAPAPPQDHYAVDTITCILRKRKLSPSWVPPLAADLTARNSDLPPLEIADSWWHFYSAAHASSVMNPRALPEACYLYAGPERPPTNCNYSQVMFP